VDSGNACGPDGRLPDASLDQKHIRDVFYRMARRPPPQPPQRSLGVSAGGRGHVPRPSCCRTDLPACRRSRLPAEQRGTGSAHRAWPVGACLRPVRPGACFTSGRRGRRQRLAEPGRDKCAARGLRISAPCADTQSAAWAPGLQRPGDRGAERRARAGPLPHRPLRLRQCALAPCIRCCVTAGARAVRPWRAGWRAACCAACRAPERLRSTTRACASCSSGGAPARPPGAAAWAC